MASKVLNPLQLSQLAIDDIQSVNCILRKNKKTIIILIDLIVKMCVLYKNNGILILICKIQRCE